MTVETGLGLYGRRNGVVFGDPFHHRLVKLKLSFNPARRHGKTRGKSAYAGGML